MLILANGSYKSGSTWQRDILNRLIKNHAIPKKYQHPGLPNWVDPNKITELLADLNYNNQRFISKSHIYNKKEIKKLYPYKNSIKIFFIQRDLKDAIVSHYHHIKNQNKTIKSFNIYYSTIGRLKAIQIVKYNRNWQNESVLDVLHSSFEDLKLNYSNEVKKYADFLSIRIADKEINLLKEQTSIKQKKKEATKNSWFFRKGNIGDGKDYFNEKNLKDINNIEVYNISWISKLLSFLIIDLRAKLKSKLSKNNFSYLLFKKI